MKVNPQQIECWMMKLKQINFSKGKKTQSQLNLIFQIHDSDHKTMITP